MGNRVNYKRRRKTPKDLAAVKTLAAIKLAN